MKSVGLDLHAASFTLAVLNSEGEVECRLTRKTSGAELVAALQGIQGRKVLIVEESHLAQWAKRTAERYVDELVICDPTRNAWIARDEFNNDATSAEKLARLHQGGFLKTIHHPEGGQESARSLFLHYYDLTHQLVRFKNKVKAVFRQEAIKTAGGHFYEEETHEEWLRKLRAVPHLSLKARQHFALLDLLDQQRTVVFAALVKSFRDNPAFGLVQTIPGVGPVLAAGYLALIETPHRFSRKNKLWRYGGQANRRQESGERVYAQGPSRSGNRPLKWVVGEHFVKAVLLGKESNRFKRRYERLVQRGVHALAAERDVRRTLLSVVRAVWMKGEPYCDSLVP